MRCGVSLRLASLLGLVLLAGCSGSGTGKDRVVNVEGDDAEMNAAMATARSKLPEFWQRFDNPVPNESIFAIKVKVTDPNGTEHFWASELHKKDGKIFGAIDNDPNIVKSVSLGQVIEIPEADISDWTYTRDKKMHGNYTLRVLLKTLPVAQADELKKMLAEP